MNRMTARPTNTHRIAILLAGALALAPLTTAYAQAATDAPPPAGMPGGKGGPRGDGSRGEYGMRGGPGMLMPGMEAHMLMRLADELALSPEQRQTVRGFFDQAQPGFRTLHEQMRANTKLMMDTQPDDPRYQSVVQQVGASSAELAQQMVAQSSQLRTQVWSVLTAEQKTRLKAKQAEMRARWDERARTRGERAEAATAPATTAR